MRNFMQFRETRNGIPEALSVIAVTKLCGLSVICVTSVGAGFDYV